MSRKVFTFILLAISSVVLVGCDDLNIESGAYPSNISNSSLVAKYSIKAESLDIGQDLSAIKEKIYESDGHFRDKEATFDNKSSAKIDMRIPRESAENLIAFIASNVSIIEENISSNDLSNSIKEKDLKLKGLEKRWNRLNDEQEKTDNIEEKRMLREELKDVENEKINIQIDLSQLNSQLEYSVINLELNEVKRYSNENDTIKGSVLLFFDRVRYTVTAVIIKTIDNLHLIIIGTLVVIGYRKLSANAITDKGQSKDKD